LLGNGAFVEDGFGGSDVVLRLGEVSAARREAGLRVLPAKVPQIDASRLDVGFFQSRVVTNLVPMEGRIQVAGVDANPSGFVGNFSLLEQIPHGEIEDFLLEFDGFLAVPFKSVRHGHGPLGGGFLLGLLGNVDGFLKVFARVLAFSHQIQHVSGSDVGRHGNRRGFESLPIERQSTFQVSFPHQLLTLLDELRLLALRGSLRE